MAQASSARLHIVFHHRPFGASLLAALLIWGRMLAAGIEVFEAYS